MAITTRSDYSIEIRHVPIVAEDARGVILDLLNTEIRHVGLVTFATHAIRGRHFHKLATQFDYVISGTLELTTHSVGQSTRKRRDVLETGDLVRIPPGVVHTFRALSPSLLLNLTDVTREDGAYEHDTYRIDDFN